jgi:glycosyltransferase involved in cell wall biosynthesis
VSRFLIIGSLAESLINFRGDLLAGLVKEGHTVTAAAPDGPAWVDEELARLGVKRVRIGMDRTGMNVIADLRLLAELVRLCRRTAPDIVLAYTAKPVIYGTLAARIARVRTIAAMITGLGFIFSEPDSTKQAMVRAMARWLYRVALKGTHIVFFQNPDDEADFRRYALLRPEHRVVVTNGSGVNLERFAYQPLPPGPLRFLMISRLLADKGVREFIAAARAIRREHPEVSFHLVGPYDSNPAAISRAEIELAESEGSIEYHGPTNDVRPALKKCHVYVLPSYREGTPRSVLEAMAVGRPVVTTDAPGCRETVTAGVNGLLVPPREPDSLTQALRWLIAAPRAELARMGDEARRIATTRYDVMSVNATIATTLLRA